RRCIAAARGAERDDDWYEGRKSHDRYSILALDARKAGGTGRAGNGGTGKGAHPALPASPAHPAYFRCLFTSLVISNMLTEDLPPNTTLSGASALIIRLFFLSCSPFFLM